MLLMDQDGFLTENNKVDHFIDGNDLYDQVLKDIKNAKEYIH
ncbi:cardiolipin synthetase [Staphylococcus aureus]|nr:cardiolipin synthetase [Staphylococcus aureus]